MTIKFIPAHSFDPVQGITKLQAVEAALKKAVESLGIGAKDYTLSENWNKWTLTIAAEDSTTVDQIAVLLQKATEPKSWVSLAKDALFYRPALKESKQKTPVTVQCLMQ